MLWKPERKSLLFHDQMPLLDLAQNAKEGEIPMSVIIGNVVIFLK